MNSAPVKRIAKVLRTLVDITFVCNMIALVIVPPLVYWRDNPFLLAGKQTLTGNLFFFWWEGLSKFATEPYTLMLSLFLLFSGICTAIVLRQGQRVLDTILRGEPFSPENSTAMKRAAVCGFLISGAALVRVVFSVCYYHSLLPLTTYNALFVPIFTMAGLLGLVMSALFRQAADMKSENDLTI